MKILAVIVDNLPTSCRACDQWYELGRYMQCSITLEYIANVKNGEKHRLCPLMTDLSYLRSRMLMQSDADVAKLNEVEQ